MLSEGKSLPNADIFLMTDDGPAKKKSNEVFTNGKIVIFAVPGAFTPTCTNQHFPSFLKNYDQIISKGVEKVFKHHDKNGFRIIGSNELSKEENIFKCQKC